MRLRFLTIRHSRRRFYEAQSSDLMRSTVMLSYIRLLYDVEREDNPPIWNYFAVLLADLFNRIKIILPRYVGNREPYHRC